MKKLSIDFFKGSDVVAIARDLLGKVLVTQIDGLYTSARIVETEAYKAFVDKGAHSYKGKRTKKNEPMYASGGTSYVYTCYGIHQLFNIVTNVEAVPDAVLIRAAAPINGINLMLQRTGKSVANTSLTKGPGNLCKALGIQMRHTGMQLQLDEIFVAADDFVLPPIDIVATRRVGIDYAGEDAGLPYRFYVSGSPYVSAFK